MGSSNAGPPDVMGTGNADATDQGLKVSSIELTEDENSTLRILDPHGPKPYF